MERGEAGVIRLARYLSNYRLESILSPVFKMIEAALSLVVPLVVAQIIDVGVAQRDTAYVTQGGLLLVAIAVVGLLSAVVAQYFAARAASGMGTALRDDLYAHIVSLSQVDIDAFGEATLVNRLGVDTVQVQEGFNRFFRLVLRSPFIVFGSLILAYTIDGTEGLIFLVVIVVLGLVVGALMRFAVKGYAGVQAALDKLTGRAAQNLAGKRTIRAYGREGYEVAAFEDEVEEHFTAQVDVGRITALTDPLTYVAINAGLVAVLWVGGGKVNVGALTTGGVVALVNYASQILVELVKLARLIVLMARGSAAAERVNEVFDTRPSMVEGRLTEAPQDNSLEFRDVSFTYRGARAPSLEHVSFRVPAGATLGVIGGTGSGKTTLADLICRTYDATEGDILIGGRSISELSYDALNAAVSRVEQRPQLFAGTISDNLAWGAASGAATEGWPAQDELRSRMDSALELAQAGNLVEAGEDALAAYIEEGATNLSGGQAQRLSIARALMGEPSVLVLDDSTSALDYETEARLRRALSEKLTHSTLVQIAQRISAVRSADAILVLDEGKQVGFGTHDELMRSCDVYRQIAESQLGAEEVASYA